MSTLKRETQPQAGFGPGILPQHEKTDGTFVTTGENNPLPTASYIQTAAGIWIPQKGNADGSALVNLSGSNVPDAQPLPSKQVGTLTKEIILANAVAFVATTPQAFNLMTISGLSKDQIRQYRRFKLSLRNTHDQAASVSIYDANLAVNAIGAATGPKIYYESSCVPINSFATISGKNGGTGIEASRKIVPEFDNGIFSNMIVLVSFPVSPTSGYFTMILEMSM
jgi:hypothetical protein